MLITALRKEGNRIAAEIEWEEFAGSPATMFIETTDEFADDLSPSGDVFVAAMVPLAYWRGERRVHVEGIVSPLLRDGIDMALEMFEHWYNRGTSIRIEPSRGIAPAVPRSTRRTASFLSGGVDALALLRCNRMDYPPHHPGYIHDCVVVHGLNTHDVDSSGLKADRRALFDQHYERLLRLSEHAGATLVPMWTNLRGFYPDFATWGAVGFGPGIISMALAMPPRFDVVLLGSVGLGMACPPGSTHPFLDGLFSTEAVRIHHAQPALTRMEKVRIVSEWPEALEVLRSCFIHTIPEDGRINCGTCEKCVRTMLALLAVGRLSEAVTFPFDDVKPAMLDGFQIERGDAKVYYEHLAVALDAAGRQDLVVPIRRKITAFLSK